MKKHRIFRFNHVGSRLIVGLLLCMGSSCLQAKDAPPTPTDKVLYQQNFSSVSLGNPPEPIKDNSQWAGTTVPMQVVDSGMPGYGKLLRCDVNGFAQLILGSLSIRKGCVYRVRLSLSSLRQQTPEILLRRATVPYTGFITKTLSISESMRDFTFVGKATEDCDDVWFLLKMNGHTTLDIDNIKVEKLNGDLPEGRLPVPGNLLLNSGFELGADGWNTRGDITFKQDDHAYEGKCLANMADDSLLSSSWYALSYRSPYVIRARARAVGGPTSGWLAVSDLIYRRGKSVFKNQPFTLKPEQGWQTIAFVFHPRPSAGVFSDVTNAYVSLRSTGTHGATLQVDAVEAVADINGNAMNADYVPHAPTEMALITDAPRNVLVQGQAINVTVLRSGSDGNVPLVMRDESDSITRQFSVPVHAGQGRITLGDLPCGYWHLQTEGSSSGKVVPGETFITVVPAMPDEPLDQWSIGTHVRSSPTLLEACWRLGMRWNRIHDVSLVLKWPHIEPKPGQWTFCDDELAALRGSHNMPVLGVLDLLPNWYDNGKIKIPGKHSRSLLLPALPDQLIQPWQAYVQKAVTHWRDQIRYWEVMNEPSNYLSPQQYVANLKHTAPVIRESDPDAVIVGMGGPALTRDWMDKAIALGAANYCDVVSFHGYGLSTWSTVAGPWDEITQVNRIRTQLANAGKPTMPIWNTEAGITLQSGWTKFHWPQLGAKPIDAAKMLPKSVAGAKASGVDKLFYYAAFELDHPSSVDSLAWINDINGVMSMPTQSMAVAISLLEGRTCKPVDMAEQKSPVVSLTFTGRGKTVHMLWSIDGTPTVQLPAHTQQVLNMWGRTMSMGQTVTLTDSPIYAITAN